MYATVGIFITLSACGRLLVLCGPCAGTEFVGPSNVNDVNVESPDLNDKDTTTLFANSLYSIPCCGVISSWEVAVEGQGKIRIQVWRRVDGTTNTYAYLGQNGWEKTTTTARIVTRAIPAINQLQVNTGDIIAIYHFNATIIRYASCNPVVLPASQCSENVYRASEIPGSTLTEGYTYTFTTLQSAHLGVTTVRNYGIKGYFTPKGQLTCANEAKTVSSTLVTGSHVTTVSTDNLDIYHAGSGFSIESMVPTLAITINSQTGEITTTGPLTPNFPSSTYVITIRVTDVCSPTNTCVLTLTVTSDPQSIIFENLPASVDVVHAPDLSTDVFTVQLSQQRDFDDVTCIIQSAVPEVDGLSFGVQNRSKTEYGVTMTTSPTYTETDLDPVILTVYCQNDQGYNGTSTLTLVFKPGTSSENRFWMIGLLLGFIIVGTLVMLFIVLFSMHASKRRSTTTGPDGRNRHRQQKRQISPDVIPTHIFVEPARTTFVNVKTASRPRHGTHDTVSSSMTSSTGNETSPIGSTGSDVTPASISSITGIGWIEPLDTGGRTRLLSKNPDNVFMDDTPYPVMKYIRKKPWRP